MIANLPGTVFLIAAAIFNHFAESWRKKGALPTPKLSTSYALTATWFSIKAMTKKFFLKDRKFELLGIRPEAREADYPLPSTIESPPFLGKWAVLNYYLPDGLMHPDDADKFLNAKQKGEHIYRCTKEEKEWVTITNDCGYSYRVNSARVIWIPKPDFAIGQEVVTTNGTFRKGKIKSRGWHFKEMCFTFCIEIEGNNGIWKAHKRRYWAHDLRLVPTNNMKKPQV